MRVLVTGGDGLLGSSLLPRLRPGHETDSFGIDDGDVADPGFVRARVEAFAPDTIVHLAAMTAVDACEGDESGAFRVNAEGARVVAAEAERVGAGVIAVSTDYVFDGRVRSGYREDDDPHPLSVYGRSKLAGEEAVGGASTRWTVVRSAWLFGPGGGNFVDTVLTRAGAGEDLRVVDDQVGSPTFAPDLAAALLEILEARARGVFHVVNAGQATWFDLAREAVRQAGLDPARVSPATTDEVGRPAPRPGFSVLDAGRARRELGVELRPWEAALADHIESRGGVAAAEEGS